ncbi:hypothetical protein CLAFUW4_01489, partial [Fulvia fulva]
MRRLWLAAGGGQRGAIGQQAVGKDQDVDVDVS